MTEPRLLDHVNIAKSPPTVIALASAIVANLLVISLLVMLYVFY